MDISHLKDESDIEEEEDDQDSELEEDLCEAREHLEKVLKLLNVLVVANTKQLTRKQHKECIDMAIDISGFLDQWETDDFANICEGGM